MNEFDLALGVIATLVLVMSLFARRLQRSVLAEPMLALLVGVAVGPIGLDWLSLEGERRVVLEQTARLTLALMLVSVGMGLPHRYAREHGRSATVLTVGGMMFAWAASTLLLVWILGLDLLPALLIGAVLTPLDPVLAAGVAVGEVPERELPGSVRHLLSVESAGSHGLGYVLVLLPAYLITHGPDEAWTLWTVRSVLWDGLAAVVIGTVVGVVAGTVHRRSLKRHRAEAGPLATTFVGLALGVVACVRLLGSSGLLAVFVAGLAYAATRTGGEKSDELRAERLHYEKTFKQILQVPVFVLLGVALPWSEWAEFGRAGVALVAAIVLLRRLPGMLVLRPFVPQLRRWDVTSFVGWFGSVGVGALHFAFLAEEHTRLAQVWPVASLVIATSVVAHDVTVQPLTRWLRHRLEGDRRA